MTEVKRPDYNNLSQHDKELLAKIRQIDDTMGYFGWPEISSLADQLENEYYKNLWNNTCKHYNHMEEGHYGML